jgi:hypothetical protein
MRARVAVVTALLVLAAAPSALADSKPNGRELWHAYPLKPDASASPAATSARTASATPAAARTPANDGGGGSWAPIALAALAAAAGAAGAVALRRRKRRVRAPEEAPPAAPQPPAAVPAQPPAPEAAPGRRTGRFMPRARPRRFQPSARPPAEPAERRFAPSPPVRDTRTVERLRAAVDMQLGREWPWPEGSEGLWRCEIGPDKAALSARFRAVLHPPDGEPPRVLAVSSAGSAAGDWQSAAPIEQAVNGLAAQLVADGWEPVPGTGDPSTRRFCWRHDRAPHVHLQETAWSA